jgi:transposase
LECAPDLSKAYNLREGLSAIFDTEQSKESATRAITNWIEQVNQSGLKCFDSFLTTLDNWLDEITNYFLDRKTSGFQEGVNNRIKVLKRRCYGITNISHLFQRIWLDLEGFKFFGV